jgi:UDP-N-acetyl-D-galactosamine dehydrogenase
LRNSRIPDIVDELREFGVNPLIHDPLADAREAQREYGVELVTWEKLSNLDGLILAVNHRFYLDLSHEALIGCLRKDGVIVDVKSVLDPADIPHRITYWSL